MTEFEEPIIIATPIPDIREKTLGAVHEAARIIFISPRTIIRERIPIDSEVGIVAQRYTRKTGIFHRRGRYDVFTETMRPGEDFGYRKGRVLIEDGEFDNAKIAALAGYEKIKEEQNKGN